MRDLEALVVSASLAAGVAIVSGAAVAAGVVAVPPARVVPAAPAAAVVVTERLHTTDAPRRAIRSVLKRLIENPVRVFQPAQRPPGANLQAGPDLQQMLPMFGGD